MRKNTTSRVMKPHTNNYKAAQSKHGTRIFKRSLKGSWVYQSYVGGDRKYFPLGLDKKEALDLADKIRGHLLLYPMNEVLEMFQRKRFAKNKIPAPTVNEVMEILRESRIASGMTEKTLRSYFDNLKKFARTVTGEKEVGDFDMGSVTDKMIRDFKSKSLDGIKDQALIQSKKRTINSNIRQLKALFSRASLFENFDMSFVDILRSQEFYKGLKKQYRLPPIDLIQKTFDLWPTTDGDVHTLIGMALHFGLRRGEILHARRSWFDLAGEKARVNITAELDFRPKGGHEGFTMGTKSMATAILNKASGDDYLITSRADSGRPAFEKALKELRAIGWERPSPMHELRKLFGSYIATTESIYISQKFLRHADSSTTNESYADVIVDENIKNLWVA